MKPAWGAARRIRSEGPRAHSLEFFSTSSSPLPPTFNVSQRITDSSSATPSRPHPPSPPTAGSPGHTGWLQRPHPSSSPSAGGFKHCVRYSTQKSSEIPFHSYCESKTLSRLTARHSYQFSSHLNVSLKLEVLLKSRFWSSESGGWGAQDSVFLNKLPTDARAASPWTTGRSQEPCWPTLLFPGFRK